MYMRPVQRKRKESKEHVHREVLRESTIKMKYRALGHFLVSFIYHAIKVLPPLEGRKYHTFLTKNETFCCLFSAFNGARPEIASCADLPVGWRIFPFGSVPMYPLWYYAIILAVHAGLLPRQDQESPAALGIPQGWQISESIPPA